MYGLARPVRIAQSSRCPLCIRLVWQSSGIGRINCMCSPEPGVPARTVNNYVPPGRFAMRIRRSAAAFSENHARTASVPRGGIEVRVDISLRRSLISLITLCVRSEPNDTRRCVARALLVTLSLPIIFSRVFMKLVGIAGICWTALQALALACGFRRMNYTA